MKNLLLILTAILISFPAHSNDVLENRCKISFKRYRLLPFQGWKLPDYISRSQLRPVRLGDRARAILEEKGYKQVWIGADIRVTFKSDMEVLVDGSPVAPSDSGYYFARSEDREVNSLLLATVTHKETGFKMNLGRVRPAKGYTDPARYDMQSAIDNAKSPGEMLRAKQAYASAKFNDVEDQEIYEAVVDMLPTCGSFYK